MRLIAAAGLLQTFGDWNAFAQTILLLASALLIWIQIRTDHRKRRVEETLTFLREQYATIQRLTIRVNHRLDVDNSVSRSQALLDAVRSDRVAERLLLRLLNLYEQLAVGVELGAYDLAAVDAADGPRLIAFFDRWQTYIRWRRSNRNPTSFAQFEKLVGKLQARRERRGWKSVAAVTVALNQNGDPRGEKSP